MINKIKLKNFTCFKNVDLNFSKGINVIIGENGTGKSNLLRLPYTITYLGSKFNGETSKNIFQQRIAEKLVSVFRPESLGRLVKRKEGKERCEIGLFFDDNNLDIEFSFASNSKSEVEIIKIPKKFQINNSIYFPTRELLSIYPGFISLYENYHLEFEETWRDTCLYLGSPTAKQTQYKKSFQKILTALEDLMNGKIVLEKNGRFYLNEKDNGKTEITLAAEGMRKIAMLAQLILTDTITENSYFFWDEPESNLNPKIIRTVAQIIMELTALNVQVFIGTHSLFLLKEIEILLNDIRYKNTPARFIGLKQTGDAVQVEQADDINDLETITTLEEELIQSDRYMEVVNAD